MKIIRVTGPVAVSSDTRYGCVLLVKDSRFPHYALRESLNMMTFIPAEVERLSVPKNGSYVAEARLEGPVVKNRRKFIQFLTFVVLHQIVMAGQWGWSFQHLLQDLIDIVGVAWDEIQSNPSLRILAFCHEGNGPHAKELLELLGLKPRIFCMQNTDRFILANGLFLVQKVSFQKKKCGTNLSYFLPSLSAFLDLRHWACSEFARSSLREFSAKIIKQEERK